MHRKIWLLLIAWLVVVPLGCGEKNDDDTDQDDKGAIDTTVDYVTGRTAINAKSHAHRTAAEASIRSGISYYEVEYGRSPRSLQELVDGQFVDKKFLKDEYGRPVESTLEGDTLVIRSILIDKETGKRTVNWELKF